MFRVSQSQANESGFTLVELLVVIAIIAILTAIAVPSFLSQRAKANDAAVRSDMKSVVTAIETAAVDNSGSVTVSTPSPGAATVGVGASSASVKLSKGVTITSGTGSTTDHYTLNGSHSGGTGAIQYDNANGGFLSPASAPVESTPSPTPSPTTPPPSPTPTPTPSPTTPPPAPVQVSEYVDSRYTDLYSDDAAYGAFVSLSMAAKSSAGYSEFLSNASGRIEQIHDRNQELQITTKDLYTTKVCIGIKDIYTGMNYKATSTYGSSWVRTVLLYGTC